MKFSITSAAMMALTIAHTAVTSPVYQELQLRQGGDVNTLLQGLRDQNLTSLADVLQDHPAVTDKMLADDTPKYFLAPSNNAMSKLPDWVANNATRLEATLLQHVLRGEFDASTFNTYPLHTIGHSLLDSADFVQLPGGAGQAVALAQSDGKTFIAEAINNDTFVAGKSAKIDSVTVQPVSQAITVPGSVTETLAFLGHKSFVSLLNNANYSDLAKTVNGMAGVTVFVPTEAAIAAYVASNPDVDSVVTNQIITVLGQHIVANRMVYSPLLIDQASMVSVSGQDVVFDNAAGTVHVGEFSAKVIQTDIMAQQGVIHLIDAVLASTARDDARAEQAQRSAAASFDLDRSHSISGPVSGTNSVTTQGKDVPASQDGSNVNHSADQNGNSAGTGQTSSGIGKKGGKNSSPSASVESINGSESSSDGSPDSSASASASENNPSSTATTTTTAASSSTKPKNAGAGVAQKPSSSSTSSAKTPQFTSSSNGAGVNIGTGLDHRNDGNQNENAAATAPKTVLLATTLLALTSLVTIWA